MAIFNHGFYLYRVQGSIWHSRFAITNELGCYAFIPEKQFATILGEDEPRIRWSLVRQLEDRYFLTEDQSIDMQQLVTDLRHQPEHLPLGPSMLYVFVLTNQCNLQCRYCQMQDRYVKPAAMTMEQAENIAAEALSGTVGRLTFEFQGGEPLLSFPVMQHVMEYTEERRGDKEVNYKISTNLTLLTEEMIEVFQKYHVEVSTFLDGGRDVHDSYRMTPEGEGTFRVVCDNIRRLQNAGIKVSAVQTATRMGLFHIKEAVHTYQDLGLHEIFIRPLTPKDHKFCKWQRFGYTPEEFIKFYTIGLDEIVKINKAGYPLTEGYAKAFLRRCLRQRMDKYMELRSPCGAGMGKFVYEDDGVIYDWDSKGNLVKQDTLEHHLGNMDETPHLGKTTKYAFCKDACYQAWWDMVPYCCECVYHPYCDLCPCVHHHAKLPVMKDERWPQGFYCLIYKGILDRLFKCFYDVYDAQDVFEQWMIDDPSER